MNMPDRCPSCNEKLVVTALCCCSCKTAITGSFDLPLFASLSAEDEKFLKTFLSARGSIKEVEKQLCISYPTVKARLEALLNKLGLGNFQAQVRESRMDIIERLERGGIPAQEAAVLLRELEN
ncbi:MAG TPA: DUF2089 domain-containing protein [Elusimicrobiales bacterium]|nr:DUF2089 domain-containing protein [Elusimicrobiales bacterium]